MPTSSMKIFVTDTTNEIVAENVKIGDKLSLAISIEEQGDTRNGGDLIGPWIWLTLDSLLLWI